jgi:hypothetical protein
MIWSRSPKLSLLAHPQERPGVLDSRQGLFVVTRICDSDLKRCHIVVVAQHTLQSVSHTKYMTIEHAQFEKHGEETSGLFLLWSARLFSLSIKEVMRIS